MGLEWATNSMIGKFMLRRSSFLCLISRNRPAGAGGGLVASIATCPLDVIKTKLQAQRAIPGHPAYEGVVGESFYEWRNILHSQRFGNNVHQPPLSRYLSTMAFVDSTVALVLQCWAIFPPGASTLLSTMVSRDTLGRFHSEA